MTRTILLAAALCILSSYSANYFAWSSLASNQAVSFTNANDAVTNNIFGTRTSHANSSKIMTKAEALANYWIWHGTTSLYNKADNRLVMKEDLVAGDILNATGKFYASYIGHPYSTGWASESGACGLFEADSVTIHYKTTLGVNTKIFGDVTYNTPFGGTNTDWFNINGTPVKIAYTTSGSSGYFYVSQVGVCLTPITITITISSSPNYLQVTATASANVDTNVTINVTVNDDIYGDVYPSCVINSGTSSCVTTPSVPASWGSGTVQVTAASPTPTTSSTQEYFMSY